ncbi:MAG: ion transporter [Cyanobacteria bacterium PR.3.49]|nr:ion transporter [Cyanobacteria bacterium PR.3.49]
MAPNTAPPTGWRRALYQTVFESNTRLGRIFDLVLIAVIITSVVTVMLNSVHSLRDKYGAYFFAAEVVITAIFTVEYVLRLICAPKRWGYAKSFFGIVDLLSVLPTYIAMFSADAHYLMIVRILRLMRIFRILKLARFLHEAESLKRALQLSLPKITVFAAAIVAIVVIVGALMYVVEGEEHGFSNIPISIYWAIVTLTTVGYGDMSPKTPLGQFLSCIVMMLGYAIIAVPTGIVSVQMHQAANAVNACKKCGEKSHDRDSVFCRICGYQLISSPPSQAPVAGGVPDKLTLETELSLVAKRMESSNSKQQ